MILPFSCPIGRGCFEPFSVNPQFPGPPATTAALRRWQHPFLPGPFRILLFPCPWICLILWWSHLPPAASRGWIRWPPEGFFPTPIIPWFCDFQSFIALSAKTHFFSFLTVHYFCWLPSSFCTMRFAEHHPAFSWLIYFFQKLNYSKSLIIPITVSF